MADDQNKFSKEELQEQLRLLAENQKQAEKLGGTYQEWSSILTSITNEIGNQVTQTSRAAQEGRNLVSIANKLRGEEDGISQLNTKQIKKLQEKAKISLAARQTLAQELIDERKITELADKGLILNEATRKELAKKFSSMG